ncbi:MAG TPA: DUF1501 domain-containing protein [Gemmataceae bacterium]|nr:DUF1501 domain-containing protein [Gemmataceae bacterium]
MLTLHENARISRRQLLQIGGLALGGLSLSSLLEAKAAAPSASPITGKSVIFLFQQGGPPQFETFDPKPDASSDIRTITGVTRTALPGVLFGDTFQQLAPLADKLSIIRSFHTGNAGHNIKPIVGPESLNANIGCLVSRVLGPTHPTTSMPTNAVLFPQSVCNDVARGSGRGDLAATGAIGPNYAPFVPGGNGQLLRNLRLNLSPERFNDRQELLSQMGRLNAHLENADFDRNQRQACEVLLSGRVADALDLSREDPRLVAGYDTSRYLPSHQWRSAQRGRDGMYAGQAKSLGKLLLMARRLCEAGCGFVTIHADYEGVWDFHADGNNLNVRDGMEAVGRTFDHAVAAFIADVESRGLQDKILLICTGEMGRTPRINRNGGRDHWARLAPLMMYGGGITPGRVIGQSTRDGGEPARDQVGTANLISTILHTVFDVGQLRLQPALSAISRLAEVPPIPVM